MNLLDTVKGYLGDEQIGGIADTLGIDHGAAKSAVGVAAPTLLAGIAQTANSGEAGARRVAAAVDGADESVLGDAGPTYSAGGEAQSMVQSGTSMLTGLFGGTATTGIVDAISRYTGLGGGVCGKLIGMVAPLVFGALKRQKTSMGLDAGGLANLLSSQRSSFLSAMPSGLSGMLSSVPGLSGLAGAPGAAAASARGYAASAADTARETGYAARDAGYAATEPAHRAAAAGRSSYGWLVPAALCALLALGLWWWVGGRGEHRAARVPRQTTPTVVTPAPPAASPGESATPAGARIGPAAPAPAGDTAAAAGLTSQVSDIFTSATNTFSQVHDATSADAAAPKVDAINSRLDALARSAKSMPTGTRSALSTTVRQWRDKLQPVTDKALATPGVGERLRPKVDDMYRKMDALMMAQ